MKYLGFDLGASSGKMMEGFLENGKLTTRVVHRFENRQTEICGGLYWDIINIYRNLLAGIQASLADRRDRLVSVGLDSYCNDFGLIGPDGRLLNQVRCYRDERTERHAAKIYGKVSAEEMYRTTGAQTALFNTSMEMAAMVYEGEKFLLDHTHKAMMLPDTLAYFLTGNMVTEYTMASVSQLFDWRRQTWAADMMRRLGIPENIFADVVETGYITGTIKPDLIGLTEADPPVSVVAVTEHDSAAAVVALPTSKDRVGFISSGTWSIVGTEVPEPIISDDTFACNIAYEGGIDHRYRQIKNVMGLWIFQECLFDYQKKTGQKPGYDEINAMAMAAPSGQCLIDPDNRLFYMPGNMIAKVQDFCRQSGQPVPEDFGHVVRCVLESLSLKYRMVYDQIEAVDGYELEQIHIVGGGAHNDLLNQWTADACQKTVYAGPYEAGLIGNLIVQMRTYGEVRDLKEGRQIIRDSFEIKEFQPEEREKWTEMYSRFVRIVEEAKHE